MRYLIDTTVIIPVLGGDHDAIDLVGRLAHEGVGTSILSYLEVWQGIVGLPHPDPVKQKMEEFFTDIPLLTVNIAVARRCAEVRAMLAKQGKNPRRRAFDLVIAATALEHSLELVTHNAKDFVDIPGLARYPI